MYRSTLKKNKSKRENRHRERNRQRDEKEIKKRYTEQGQTE